MLVNEAARALTAFHDDPAGLVAACRRIIDRQLTCGPLWWLCARMLCAHDPFIEARAALAEVEADPTRKELVRHLPDDGHVTVMGSPAQSLAPLRRRGDLSVVIVDLDGEGYSAVRELTDAGVDADLVDPQATGPAVMTSDVLLLEAFAVGPTHALVAAGSAPAAAMAARSGVPVWLIAGAGRLLPGRMFDALEDRWSTSVDPLAAAEELLPLEWCDRIAGIRGVVEVAEALGATDCPIAPELFRLAG